MATGPVYQKYGGFSTPDIKSMTQQQSSTGAGFSKALGGIEKLLKQAEDSYRETNTLNMQEYLKGQIRDTGLGGEPVDKVAIRKKFGSMVNMDRLDETVAGETKQLRNEAANSASLAASQTMSAGGDEIAGRKAFEQTIRDAGGDESFVSSSTQDWSDKNATRFKDALTLKTRKNSARIEAMLSAVANNEDYGVTSTSLLADASESERPALRREMDKAFEDAGKLTDRQNEGIASNMLLNKIQGDKRVAGYQASLDGLLAQQAAQQDTGIMQDAYTLASKQRSELGRSVTGEIGEKVTNFLESFSSNSDDKRIKNLHKSMVKDGIKAEDADAILTQAFGTVYEGDSIFGNDISGDNFTDIETIVSSLSTKVKNKNSLSSQISAARLKVSDTAADEATKGVELQKQLRKAARDTRYRKVGSTTQEAAYKQYAANQLKSSIPAIGDTAEITQVPEEDELTRYADEFKKSQGIAGDVPETGNTETQFVKRILANDPTVNPPMEIPLPKKTRTTLGGEVVEVDKSPLSTFINEAGTPEYKVEQVESLKKKLDREQNKSKDKQRPAEIARIRRMIKKLQDGGE